MSDDQEFDLSAFIQSPMAMIATAVSAADTAKKTFVSLVEAVQSLQRSAEALESLLGRIDTMVGAVEAPAKVLGPEMERFAQRMVAMSDLLDRTPMEQLPELFETLSAQMMSVMGGLAELPKRLGPLGELFGGAAGLIGMAKPLATKTAASASVSSKSVSSKSTARNGTAASSKPKAAPSKKSSSGAKVDRNGASKKKAAANRAALAKTKRK
jgi:ABC-type transporter Mla subunit MlaD